jgi:hypothetical protein
MAALTSAINIIPNRYGRMEALNLFPAKPVRTRQVIVEEQNGVLNLLPTMPPGSPGHCRHPWQAQGALLRDSAHPARRCGTARGSPGHPAFGSETEMESVAGVMARHLETMRNKHAITLEHLRMGASRA